jgi:hypothetical protein
MISKDCDTNDIRLQRNFSKIKDLKYDNPPLKIFKQIKLRQII